MAIVEHRHARRAVQAGAGGAAIWSARVRALQECPSELASVSVRINHGTRLGVVWIEIADVAVGIVVAGVEFETETVFERKARTDAEAVLCVCIVMVGDTIVVVGYVVDLGEGRQS